VLRLTFVALHHHEKTRRRCRFLRELQSSFTRAIGTRDPARRSF
jgi:hypothetical protein